MKPIVFSKWNRAEVALALNKFLKGANRYQVLSQYIVDGFLKQSYWQKKVSKHFKADFVARKTCEMF